MPEAGDETISLKNANSYLLCNSPIISAIFHSSLINGNTIRFWCSKGG